MKRFVTIFVLCCMSISLTCAFGFPKLDVVIGRLINPSVIDKETVRVPAVPGKTQTETIVFDSPDSIDHVRHVNKADHQVKVDVVYSEPDRKRATITVEAPEGKDIKSNFVFFKPKPTRSEVFYKL